MFLELGSSAVATETAPCSGPFEPLDFWSDGSGLFDWLGFFFIFNWIFYGVIFIRFFLDFFRVDIFLNRVLTYTQHTQHTHTNCRLSQSVFLPHDSFHCREHRSFFAILFFFLPPRPLFPFFGWQEMVSDRNVCREVQMFPRSNSSVEEAGISGSLLL